MNLNDFKKLLEQPTKSLQEHAFASWLVRYVKDNNLGDVWTDSQPNVYIVKGQYSEGMPCVCAHIDSVFNLKSIQVENFNDDVLIGFHGKDRCGIGGDDKAGVWTCLELLRRHDNIACALFAAEEIGCLGSTAADADFIDNMGYFLEFDCPGRDLFSYSNGGVQLFEHSGTFIKTAWPVLQKFGVTKAQDHPYTDVKAIRLRRPVSCINLPCGYYRWHTDNEYVRISDVENAIGLGGALIKELGSTAYPFANDRVDESKRIITTGYLDVKDIRMTRASKCAMADLSSARLRGRMPKNEHCVFDY